MKQLLTFAVVTALCAPAFAQKTGSVNREAPEVKQTVKHGEESYALDYSSIYWARGDFMKALMDKENGARARARLNGMGASRPLASFKTSTACKCGDLELAGGEYKVYFTISEECEWQLNFLAEGKEPLTMKLMLMDTPEVSKRLMMCLFAGDEGGAGLYVSFGKQFCMLTFDPIAKDDGR